MFFATPVWPISWEAPYDDAIKRIARLGFKSVELIAWNGQVLIDYYTKETIAHLKKLLKDSGLRMTNFNNSPRDLCSTDKKLRQASKDSYKKAVEVAHELGAETLTSVSPYPFSMTNGYKHILELPKSQIWTIKGDLNLDFSANYQQFVEDMKELCQWNADAGLKLLIEPHPYRWVNSAQSMLRLMEHVGAANLGFNLDPSHLFASGEFPQRTIYELKGKVWHAHFSDNDTLTNAHWRPGTGKIDWHAVMQALKDTGFNGEISFELEDVPGAANHGGHSTPEMDDELRQSIKYISDICAELGIPIEK